jgi:chorismate mutase/prephenate dehydratase
MDGVPEPLVVAYQGVEGSYSDLAATRRYASRPGGVRLVGCPTFRAAAEAVRSGTAACALLPIENSTAGSVHEVYDLLAAGGLTITGEAVERIEHCLLGLPGATVEGLRAVLSHPQALSQCEDFLRAHPWLEARPAFDTAGAARAVRGAGDPSLGAIAGRAAAAVYGLVVLAESIQSQEGNFTRFVELARAEARSAPPRGQAGDGPRKTSLLLTLPHRPGALAAVLQALAARGANLTKLESRPLPAAPWEYRFYLDVEGDAAAEPLASALAEIVGLTAELRVLGSYPRAAAAD